MIEKIMTSSGPISVHKELVGDIQRYLLIVSPHTWPTNEEIDLGDGTFGRRRTGTITSAANIVAAIIYAEGIPSARVLSSGGFIDRGDGVIGSTGVIPGANGDLITGFFVITEGPQAGRLQFNSKSYLARTSSPYDMWVRYTKR
jgi:hypothetical protein